MAESATLDVSPELKDLGDKIAALTLKQAKELSDYIEHAYGIKPAAGGAVMMAAPAEGGGAAAAAEPTEFDVVLTGFGDKKLDVVKVVKAITGAARTGEVGDGKVVEGAPAKIKEKVSKEEANKVKEELEKAGASVELKA